MMWIAITYLFYTDKKSNTIHMFFYRNLVLHSRLKFEKKCSKKKTLKAESKSLFKFVFQMKQQSHSIIKKGVYRMTTVFK